MKRIIFIIIIPLIICSCSKGQPTLLKQAFDKIKNANSFKIKNYSKMSYKLDTSTFKAAPYIRQFAFNDINYKNKKVKFQFFEKQRSDIWFDLSLMEGNNWYIGNYNDDGKLIIDTMNLTLKEKNYNHYEDFKSNYRAYSILFFPNKYFNILTNWKLISDERIENEDTWLYERSFRCENGFNVKYKINISKADTFLRRFTVICSEYEKIHEVIEVFSQLDILSHNSLGENCDTIFDINKQMQKYKSNNAIIAEHKSIKETLKDTANILLNSNLITMTGDSMKLSTIKGKWILIDFWYVGCYPCYKAMDFFNKMNIKYKDKGLVIYGINPMDNDRIALTRLFNDKGLTYQYLIDPKGICTNKIGVRGFPQMILISPDKKIVWQHYGYTTSMDALLEKVIEDKISKK